MEPPEKRENSFQEFARLCILHPTKFPVEAFLLSHKSYKAKKDLLDLWVEVFAASKEGGASESQAKNALEFLRIWLRQHYGDFSRAQRATILSKIREHAGTAVENEFKLIFVQASNRVQQSGIPSLPRQVRKNSNQDSTASDEESADGTRNEISVLKNRKVIGFLKASNKFKITGTTADRIARQLTMREVDLLKKITPREFLDQNWQNEDKITSSPNLTENIEKFNEVSFWVSTSILCESTIITQATLLRRFIKVAHKLLQWGNFNGIMQMLSGLGNVAVARLKETWKLLPHNTHAKFQRLEELMAPQQNFRNYRDRFKDAPFPKLPYLAVVLRDVTFINVGNEKYRPEGTLNEDRVMLLYEQISDVQKLQGECDGYEKMLFPKAPDPKAIRMDYFTSLPYVDDDDVLFALSLLYAPQQTDLGHSSAENSNETIPLTRGSRAMTVTGDAPHGLGVDSTLTPSVDELLRNRSLSEGDVVVTANKIAEPPKTPQKPVDEDDGNGWNISGEGFDLLERLNAKKKKKSKDTGKTKTVKRKKVSLHLEQSAQEASIESDDSLSSPSFEEGEASDFTEDADCLSDSTLDSKEVSDDAKVNKVALSPGRVPAGEHGTHTRRLSVSIVRSPKADIITTTKGRSTFKIRTKKKTVRVDEDWEGRTRSRSDSVDGLVPGRKWRKSDLIGIEANGGSHSSELPRLKAKKDKGEPEPSIMGKKGKLHQKNVSLLSLDDGGDDAAGSGHEREEKSKKKKKKKEKSKKKGLLKLMERSDPGLNEHHPTEFDSRKRRLQVKCLWKGQSKIVTLDEGAGFSTFLQCILKKYSIPLDSRITVWHKGKEGEDVESAFISDARTYSSFLETCGSALIEEDDKTTRYVVWIDTDE